MASLEARLEVERRRRRSVRLDDIVQRFCEVRVVDDRNPNGIIRYDADGVPT